MSRAPREKRLSRRLAKSRIYHSPPLKALFSKFFPSTHTKTQAGVFKFLLFEERFHDGLEEPVGLTIER